MLFLNSLNPFNFRETVLTLPPSLGSLQQILNILQNELFYPFTAKFGVYRFALILYNI